jgi:hypothetical protein
MFDIKPMATPLRYSSEVMKTDIREQGEKQYKLIYLINVWKSL